MKAAELLVKCLENEGVEFVFGIPGEENIDIMDALLDSRIRFVTTRHEQGAAFMADVYGRLTGRAGVCMATLGPGATNLITGFADANMDRAPIVAIAGQGATTRLHKESHQILDLVTLFHPIAKYATQIREPEITAEIVRKAFKVAQTEKPGGAFIDFPENIAEANVESEPIPVQSAYTSDAPDAKVVQAAKIIAEAKFPVILAGNGVIRQGASDALVSFAEMLRIPVANSFMAKGVVPFSNPLSLGTIGLKARDLPWFAFDKSDCVICVGYDMVEYHPDMWNPRKDKTIVHVDALPAEVDAHYIVAVGVLGDLTSSLRGIALKSRPKRIDWFKPLRDALVEDRCGVCERHRIPGQAAEDRLGPARSAGAGGHRDLGRRRAQDVDGADVPRGAAEHLHHQQRLRIDGDCGAGRGRGEARLSGSQGRRRHGRRRLPDELAGDRDRAADEDAVRDPDLERFRVRPHHLAPAAPFRPAEPHRVQEPGLREVRGELRREGLSRRAYGGPRADAQARARRRHGRDHRLSGRLFGEHEAHRALEEPRLAALAGCDRGGGTVKVNAAVLHAMGAKPPFAQTRPLAIETLELAPPGPGEVLVKVAAAGLCHSDLSVINGDRPRPMPMALGHEASGIVEALGDGVTDLKRGDHVVMVFVPSCGHCPPCAEGRPALCEPGAAANGAGTLLSGARRLSKDGQPINHHLGCSVFADHAVVSRRSMVKIDPELPLDEAALFGCAVLTGVGAVVNTAQVRAGASVAVIGLGGVGLASLLGARAAGARQIVAVDLSDAKLELAKSSGATHTFNASAADTVEKIREATGGGVEYAFELAGSVRALETRVQDHPARRNHGHRGPAAADRDLRVAAGQSRRRGAHASRAATSGPACRRATSRATSSSTSRGGCRSTACMTGRLALDEINHGFDLLHEGKAVRQVVVFQ